MLADLVALPSVNPAMAPAGAPGTGEEGVAAYVLDWCAAHGLAAHLRPVAPGRPNVVVDLGLRRPRTLLLPTHMDTVPGDTMGERAYRPEVREGRLYGRGACDAKGQLAAMLVALAHLGAERERLRVNVVLVAAMDEEHTFQGALAMVADGLRADGAVVGEPTGLRAVIAHKGVVRWGLRVRGRAAHTSRPAEGVNAVDGMMDVLQALRASWKEDFTVEHPLVGRATAVVTAIHAGVAPNVVPESCHATIDRRLLPDEDPAGALGECDAVLDALRAAGPAWTVEREEPFVSDYGMETSPREPIVGAALEAIRRVTGGDSPPMGVPYGTDASKLSRLGGIPCVVLGAGDIAQAHTDDEWVELDGLAQAAAIYEQIAFAFGEGAS
ncbi:MAG: ArgE/DapE family deacylase [Chloroflexota bacterium]